MNRTPVPGRLPARADALAASAVTAPAVLATSLPLSADRNKHPPLPAHPHTAATGGVPGWQIAVAAASSC